MKKVLVIMVVGLVLGLANISAAHASITIDGLAGGSEWVAPFNILANDPNEVGVDNGHDIKTLYAQWATVGGDIYVRTDMWAKPSLTKETDWENDSYVAWQFDFNGDGSMDLTAKLIKETDFGHADDLVHYYVGGTEYGVAYWGMKDIYEVLIPDIAVPAFNPAKFQMRIISESASISGDDNLPDTGWTTKTPEPGSMALVGMGLFGFVGSLFRRKFNA